MILNFIIGLFIAILLLLNQNNSLLIALTAWLAVSWLLRKHPTWQWFLALGIATSLTTTSLWLGSLVFTTTTLWFYVSSLKLALQPLKIPTTYLLSQVLLVAVLLLSLQGIAYYLLQQTAAISFAQSAMFLLAALVCITFAFAALSASPKPRQE